MKVKVKVKVKLKSVQQSRCIEKTVEIGNHNNLSLKKNWLCYTKILVNPAMYWK